MASDQSDATTPMSSALMQAVTSSRSAADAGDAFHAVFSDMRFNFGSGHGRVKADEEEPDGAHALVPQFGHGLDEFLVSFDAVEAAEQANDQIILVESEFPADLFAAILIEAVFLHIHAAVDEP